MAPKAEQPLSPSEQRLALWLSFAKACVITFLICVTILEINKREVKGKIRVAEIQEGQDSDDSAAAPEMNAKAQAAPRKK